MPSFVGEHDFWQHSPAADQIFAYRRDNEEELGSTAWGFDRGAVSDDGRSTWALFSHVALTGWGKDELVISASLQEDGNWEVTHRVTRAK
jgi:hypothetical protein